MIFSASAKVDICGFSPLVFKFILLVVNFSNFREMSFQTIGNNKFAVLTYRSYRDFVYTI